MIRQQRRRAEHRLLKAKAAAERRLADAETLKSMREKRQPYMLPKKHPGKLMSSARPFKKPVGEDRWRTRDLQVLPNGLPVPAGYEASFHSTKGLRVVRTRAA